MANENEVKATELKETETNLTDNSKETEVYDFSDEPSSDFAPEQMDDLSENDEDEEENVANSFEEGFTSETFDTKAETSEEKLVETPAPKAPTSRTQRTSTRRTSTARKAEAQILEDVGYETDSSAEQLKDIISPEEQEEREWYELKNLAKAHSLVWGKIAGVQNGFGETGVGLYVIVTIPKFQNKQVLIAEKDFWLDSQNFGKSYDGLSKRDQETRRMNAVTYHFGARIPFFIRTLSRTKVKDDYEIYQTPYKYTIVGDRKSAMTYLQNYWFFNKRADNGMMIRMDGTYGANVLQVRPEGVKVECCGVETYISAYELSGKKYIENCYDFCKPGDKIPVRIQKLHVHKAGEPIVTGRRGSTAKTYPVNTVYLTVSGRLFDIGFTPKNLALMSTGGIYLGSVRSYNKTTGVYSINLANGVTGTVQASRVAGDVNLDIGDRVYFTVMEKKESYVRGRCRKI